LTLLAPPLRDNIFNSVSKNFLWSGMAAAR
jgi:hypothetical protein